jgi:hypothetical protein
MILLVFLEAFGVSGQYAPVFGGLNSFFGVSLSFTGVFLACAMSKWEETKLWLKPVIWTVTFSSGLVYICTRVTATVLAMIGDVGNLGIPRVLRVIQPIASTFEIVTVIGIGIMADRFSRHTLQEEPHV